MLIPRPDTTHLSFSIPRYSCCSVLCKCFGHGCDNILFTPQLWIATFLGSKRSTGLSHTKYRGSCVQYGCIFGHSWIHKWRIGVSGNFSDHANNRVTMPLMKSQLLIFSIHPNDTFYQHFLLTEALVQHRLIRTIFESHQVLTRTRTMTRAQVVAEDLWVETLLA